MTLEPRLPPCLAATEPCGGPGFTGCPVAWLGTVNDPCLAATEVTVRTSLTQGLPAAWLRPLQTLLPRPKQGGRSSRAELDGATGHSGTGAQV